jgi:hypothetical protein
LIHASLDTHIITFCSLNGCYALLLWQSHYAHIASGRQARLPGWSECHLHLNKKMAGEVGTSSRARWRSIDTVESTGTTSEKSGSSDMIQTRFR